ncbi:MAG TPA: hypothetical protein ENJ79_06105 [Gammaproteobacteria bacterium]|nr:hypothetical protein [Gammaproteobacteria bacterium]
MDPVARLNQLLEVLRLRQQASRPARAQRGDASARAAQSAKPGTARDSRVRLDDLNHRIAQRIQRLDAGERRGGKAVQIFVDSVLAWEFGEGLLQSEAFSRYSREIRAAMSSDPALRKRLEQLLDTLTTRN